MRVPMATANSYQQELEDLDAEVEEILSAIPADSRSLVTNHSVFAYFADRYDFEILGSNHSKFLYSFQRKRSTTCQSC